MSGCRICENTFGNKSYVAREMMFGYRDEFGYFECAKCGCLQIEHIPEDLSKYYPENYYSFKHLDCSRDNFLKSYLRHQKAKYSLHGNNFLGAILSKVYGTPEYYQWLKRASVGFDSEILDVGCGTGGLLLRMQPQGFVKLTGADPYIEHDIFYKNGVKVLKRDVDEINQQFDFIMLHHSFEHIADPLPMLKELHRILRQGGYLLIRIPVASSYAWRTYGVDWVQLDAPRHLFLHTPKSIKLLATQSGFQLEDVVFDSTDFQFWGSEQYIKGVHLMDENSLYIENPKASIFSKGQIRSFRKRAMELNEVGDGDQACFYLHKN